MFKKAFVVAMSLFSCNVLNATLLKCVSMNNQKCKIGPEIININSNEPSFYPYNIFANKCNSGTVYIVLIVIAFLIIIAISTTYFYFHWCLKRSNIETTTY